VPAGSAPAAELRQRSPRRPWLTQATRTRISGHLFGAELAPLAPTTAAWVLLVATTVILLVAVFKVSNAVELRVALADIEPAIWRRLVVPRTFHLGQLHRVIQAAFGWWDYHLHEFRVGGLSYGDAESGAPEFERDPRRFDETEVRLLDFGRGDGVGFVYRYDFGDHWDHTVELERLLVLDPAPRVATCSDGARARPPEDVGGVDGYAGFLAILADPQHPEYRDTKRWVGGHFDPEWFDLALTDRDVRQALRANRRIRLHQPARRRQNRSS